MRLDILDHGYIELIECWGTGKGGRNVPTYVMGDHDGPSGVTNDYEVGIVEAARQSTQASFRSWHPYRMCEECGQWAHLGAPITPECTGRGPHQWKEYPKGDEGLMQFLFNGKPQHATPFEFAGAIIEVQAPIMVFREWHRHRVQAYNEMSARYAPLRSPT